MNSIRAWTFAVSVGLLALFDWSVPTVLAGGDEEGPRNALKVEGASVTAVSRDVEEDGRKKPHFFLEVEGDLSGTIAVRLAVTPFRPESRMMPRPRVVWEKAIAIDTAASRSVDLGPLPEGAETDLIDLTASAGDGVFVTLLISSGGMKPLTELLP